MCGLNAHLCVLVCSAFPVFPVPEGNRAAGVGSLLNEFPVHTLSSEGNISSVTDCLVIVNGILLEMCLEISLEINSNVKTKVCFI